jgi:5-methyltetrahydrofolate--homocysteine methyltransferase
LDHLYHEIPTNLVIRESTAVCHSPKTKLPSYSGGPTMKDDNFKPIYQGIIAGDAATVKQEVQLAVDANYPAEDILKKGLVPAMKEVGELFEKGEYYVPEMLISARAMQGGLEILKPLLASAEVEPAGTVVLGTVQGDLHDIGKNLVGMMLEGAGFSLIDLGTDVSPDKFVETVRDNKSDIVAMSALLTTTMPAMKTTIDALSAAGLRDKVKVMIGGAPVTGEYAESIGADGFAEDASRAASLAQKLLA